MLPDCLKEAVSVSDIDVTVLLRGETGTGKSLLAKVIHNNSRRKYKPFVHINCANLPEDLLESELFGAVKGAHSSAHADRKGRISAAEEGILFLDEIGELPLSVQAKLLQFLEEGIYYPLGSKVPQTPDVRVIVASNIDFEEAVREKTFRQDLYYRICVFPLNLPALRDCNGDIILLVDHFIKIYNTKYKTGTPTVAPKTVFDLEQYDWPGNVRELEHKIQQAVIRAKHDDSDHLSTNHFFPTGLSKESAENPTHPDQGKTYRESKSSWEKGLLSQSLAQNDWNVSKTAKSLAIISRSQINKLIKDHNIKRDSANESLFK